MHNYSDTTARAYHDKEAQVIRAVFCTFMRHCCKARLANNYRNESLWHRSGYGKISRGKLKFCINICEGGGIFKAAMAAYLHTIGRTRKYSRSRCCFLKNDANVPKAQGGKCL